MRTRTFFMLLCLINVSLGIKLRVVVDRSKGPVCFY
jgi:hypothetical protein